MSLVQLLGYAFRDESLLDSALTHPSFSRKDGVRSNYQRLEFLGDRALSLGVSKMLYDTFPEDSEAGLTLRLIHLVRKETVAKVARDLGIISYIKVDTEQVLVVNESILSDVMEAIIGAVCIDSGFEVSMEFVSRHWSRLISVGEPAFKDAKSLLQEWSQRELRILPEYKLVETSGPPHSPCFTVAVKIGEEYFYTAQGTSKREAQMKAAELCMANIKSMQQA